MTGKLRGLRSAAVLLAASALLSACADSPGAPGESAPPPSVEGSWGNTADPSQPSLDFAAGGRVSGTDGCNRLMGHWAQDGAAVTLIDLAGTMMYCQDVDTWLSAAATAELNGETLTLFNAGGDPIGTLQR